MVHVPFAKIDENFRMSATDFGFMKEAQRLVQTPRQELEGAGLQDTFDYVDVLAYQGLIARHTGNAQAADQAFDRAQKLCAKVRQVRQADTETEGRYQNSLLLIRGFRGKPLTDDAALDKATAAVKKAGGSVPYARTLYQQAQSFHGPGRPKADLTLALHNYLRAMSVLAECGEIDHQLYRDCHDNAWLLKPSLEVKAAELQQRMFGVALPEDFVKYLGEVDRSVGGMVKPMLAGGVLALIAVPLVAWSLFGFWKGTLTALALLVVGAFVFFAVLGTSTGGKFEKLHKAAIEEWRQKLGVSQNMMKAILKEFTHGLQAHYGN